MQKQVFVAWQGCYPNLVAELRLCCPLLICLVAVTLGWLLTGVETEEFATAINDVGTTTIGHTFSRNDLGRSFQDRSDTQFVSEMELAKVGTVVTASTRTQLGVNSEVTSKTLSSTILATSTASEHSGSQMLGVETPWVADEVTHTSYESTRTLFEAIKIKLTMEHAFISSLTTTTTILASTTALTSDAICLRSESIEPPAVAQFDDPKVLLASLTRMLKSLDAKSKTSQSVGSLVNEESDGNTLLDLTGVSIVDLNSMILKTDPTVSIASTSMDESFLSLSDAAELNGADESDVSTLSELFGFAVGSNQSSEMRTTASSISNESANSVEPSQPVSVGSSADASAVGSVNQAAALDRSKHSTVAVEFRRGPWWYENVAWNEGFNMDGVTPTQWWWF